MNGFCKTCLVAVMCSLFLSACSSAPSPKANAVAKSSEAPVAVKASPKVAIVKKEKVPEVVYPQDLEVSHAFFFKALEMDLRGDRNAAAGYIQAAYEADPGSRYLAFETAKRMFARGEDSLAFSVANKAKTLKGRRFIDQYALLARLYVRDGSADSARKYFNIALDSSHYQDMSLVYDYSLFLEAVKDEKELVRIYDILLPQVNYVPSLFQRQLSLLVDQKRDSAIVDLFANGYEATGDKKMQGQLVQLLILQKRFPEARAIVDSIKTSTEDDEKMVVLMMNALAETNRDSAYAFLQQKYIADSVRTPILLDYLGHYDFIYSKMDSAKVHLAGAIELLKDKPVYVANGYRTLASIALQEDKKKDAVMYAEKADSASMGGEKAMLAMTYGYAGMYKKAYHMLDSVMEVYSKWDAPVGVTDASAIQEVKMQKLRVHRQLQNVFARVLTFEALDIEKDVKADDTKRAYAKEAREKAELFWESMVMSDSLDMGPRFYMAMNLERMKRYDESFALFEMLLKQPASSGLYMPEVENYYGYTLVDLNRSPEEVERGYALILKAISSFNANDIPEAYLDSKAWGLFRKGKFDEALKVMESLKGEDLKKDDVYWEHMAAIQAALGMTEEAKKSYKKLIKLNPNHSAAKAYLSGNKK